MNNKKAAYWIEKLNLLPHPEGGYFAETYRSEEGVKHEHLPVRYSGDRSFATAIYFLVHGGSFSALHRIKSDEIWHFYAGSRLTIYVIDPGGQLEEIHVGSDFEKGEVFQAAVKAGSWFGSRVYDSSSFALVGCTVSPGFDFDDFELADRATLVRQFPQHRDVISLLTQD
jgi:hypothetical protein